LSALYLSLSLVLASSDKMYKRFCLGCTYQNTKPVYSVLSQHESEATSSFIHIHSLTYLLTNLLTHLLTHWLTHWLTCSPPCSKALTCLLTQSLVCSLTGLFTQTNVYEKEEEKEEAAKYRLENPPVTIQQTYMTFEFPMRYPDWEREIGKEHVCRIWHFPKLIRKVSLICKSTLDVSWQF